MRELTDNERIVKVVHVAQKWLEQIVGNNDLDQSVLEVAFKKATETSKQIIAELKFTHDQDEVWVDTWIQIGIFAGFISGWNAHRLLSQSALDDMSLVNQATQVAYRITDKVFENMLSEPKSLLISGLHEAQVGFLKEVLERSLFSGYLEGISHATETSNNRLSSLVLDPTIEV